MKKLLIASFLLLTILFSLSCQNVVENEYFKSKAPVLSFENVSLSANTIKMTAIAEWSNGCGSYSHYNTNIVDSDIFITVYGQEPDGATCTCVMITFEAPISIEYLPAGEYNLHFWQNDSTSLDTTIVVD